MLSDYSSRLDKAERTPDWDLQALRAHIVAAANTWDTSNTSRDDQRRFAQLCKKYRERLHNFSPSE